MDGSRKSLCHWLFNSSLLEWLKGCQEPSCPLSQQYWGCGGHFWFLAWGLLFVSLGYYLKSLISTVIKLDCEKADLLQFLDKLSFMLWIMRLWRTLQVPDWSCIKWKVYEWLKEVPYRLKSFAFRNDCKGVNNPPVHYVINTGVVEDTGGSWFRFYSFKFKVSWR